MVRTPKSVTTVDASVNLRSASMKLDYMLSTLARPDLSDEQRRALAEEARRLVKQVVKSTTNARQRATELLKQRDELHEQVIDLEALIDGYDGHWLRPRDLADLGALDAWKEAERDQ